MTEAFSFSDALRIARLRALGRPFLVWPSPRPLPIRPIQHHKCSLPPALVAVALNVPSQLGRERIRMAPENGDSNAPPPPPDIWGEGLQVTYLIRTPWQWVMRHVKKERMTEVESAADLPSAKLAKLDENENGIIDTPSATPATRARRRQRSTARRANGPSALKIEVSNPKTGAIVMAVHGTSSALDGIEDKDEMVRTQQRCRCEHLNLSPKSILINWDVTREECVNVVGTELPVLESNKSEEVFAVLKEPMGSQGKGIYFVRDADEIHRIVNDHRQRALQEPMFLDNLITAKGRIPSWVLQAEVVPPLLIRGGRKFHIRTYLVVIERPDVPELCDVYIFDRHELRIAGTPVIEFGKERNSLAHITNGALSDTTERRLLDEEPEMTEHNYQEKIELFVAEIFGKHLLPDISRRVSLSLSQEESLNIHRFVVAGLDLMVAEDGRIYLLEANVHPAAPPESTVNATFKNHLVGFVHDLVELAVGRPSPHFQSTRDILARHGV